MQEKIANKRGERKRDLPRVARPTDEEEREAGSRERVKRERQSSGFGGKKSRKKKKIGLEAVGSQAKTVSFNAE